MLHVPHCNTGYTYRIEQKRMWKKTPLHVYTQKGKMWPTIFVADKNFMLMMEKAREM